MKRQPLLLSLATTAMFVVTGLNAESGLKGAAATYQQQAGGQNYIINEAKDGQMSATWNGATTVQPSKQVTATAPSSYITATAATNDPMSVSGSQSSVLQNSLSMLAIMFVILGLYAIMSKQKYRIGQQRTEIDSIVAQSVNTGQTSTAVMMKIKAWFGGIIGQMRAFSALSSVRPIVWNLVESVWDSRTT